MDPLHRTTSQPRNHSRLCHQPTTILPQQLRHPSTNGQLPSQSPPTTPNPNTSRVHRHPRKHPHRQHRHASRYRHHSRLRHQPTPILPQPASHPRTNGHPPQPSPQTPATNQITNNPIPPLQVAHEPVHHMLDTPRPKRAPTLQHTRSSVGRYVPQQVKLKRAPE